MIGAGATSGRFEVLSRIAAGGMGEVYRARMSSGGGATKQIALKVVLDQHAEDPHYAEMLIAEAKVAMSLSHANVVQAFDAGRLGQRFFLAMELVDGATVRDLLKRAGPLPAPQAVTVAVEALKGLDYAHRFRDPDTGEPLGIVHRDVSPSNLLVSREGEVKVADFGIAQSTHADEEEGAVKGKIGYMSPEQIRAEALDRRTDVYAMGVVLYEMLTCARPFGAKATPERIARIVAGELEPPSAFAEDLDPELERIVLKAMSRRREDRYPNAAAFRQELERWALEAGVLLSTADLADHVADLPARADSQPSVPVAAPLLEDGTVLTRSTEAGAGLSVLRPSLDLGANLNAALGEIDPPTAQTVPKRAPAPPAPEAVAEAPSPPRGGLRRLAIVVAVAAATAGAAGAVIWAGARPQAAPEDPVATDHQATAADALAPPELDAPANTVASDPGPAAADAPPTEPAPSTAGGPATAAAPEPTQAAEPARPAEPAPAPRGAPGAGRAARRAEREHRAPPRGTARVWIASDPWATVTMDGRPIGRTTLNGREVPAGRHVFVLRNEAAGLSHRFVANLAPGEEQRFSIDLSDP